MSFQNPWPCMLADMTESKEEPYPSRAAGGHQVLDDKIELETSALATESHLRVNTFYLLPIHSLAPTPRNLQSILC